MSNSECVVALIGTGTMGAPIGRCILDAGHELHVHDRVPAAAEQLVADGATWHESAASAADGCDVVVCSLPGPDQVAEAVVGPDGILAGAHKPGLAVDVSTNSPEMVAHLRSACADVGVAFLDAPVSGGVAKAKTGTLAVMVGATDDEFASALPVLEAFGGDVMHVGASGTGTIAKLVNNQLFLAGGVLVQEAYTLAAALGMNPADIHEVISKSSAGPYAKLAPLLMGRRFDDVIFRMDIAAKDIALAVEAANTAGLDLPATRAAAEVYEASVDSGDGEKVFHATLAELERRGGVQVPALVRKPRPAQGDG